MKADRVERWNNRKSRLFLLINYCFFYDFVRFFFFSLFLRDFEKCASQWDQLIAPSFHISGLDLLLDRNGGDRIILVRFSFFCYVSPIFYRWLKCQLTTCRQIVAFFTADDNFLLAGNRILLSSWAFASSSVPSTCRHRVGSTRCPPALAAAGRFGCPGGGSSPCRPCPQSAWSGSRGRCCC
uniref:(northern house mosquito) hypothetical protein n=1 Tax=Culex pipiens TaxID=7175 RepID=A0A8D8HPQ2_CULPI